MHQNLIVRPLASVTVLAVTVRKRLGETLIDVDFTTNGRVTALFGPSGSGKTSIINMIAGLIAPEHGQISLDEKVLLDTAQRISIPAHKRRIGYVFQDARLFPHMTVRKNLDYGRAMNGLELDPQEDARVLDMLAIRHLVDRLPGGLSGGEKQRVAIGRALLLKPQLLLLDEPLASLDSARKEEILPYLEWLRDSGIPMIYVTHDNDEVQRMADTIVQLASGRVIKMIDNHRAPTGEHT